MNRKLLIVCVLIVLWTVSCAWGEEYSFVTLEFPPLEYTGSDGKVEGIAVEMVTRIMKKLGHTVHIKAYPWTRALAVVQAGKADAIFTCYRTSEREEFLDYCTQPLLHQAIYFYRKKGADIVFDGNLEALKGKRIGVVSTISYGSKFDQARTRLQQVEKAHKLEHNFQKLLLGRIDLVVSNFYTGEYTIRKLGLSGKIERVPQEIETVLSYVAFCKNRNLTALRDQFDREIVELKKSGDYAEILHRFQVDIEETNE